MRLRCTPRGERCCFQALSSIAPLIYSQNCTFSLGLMQRLRTPSSSPAMLCRAASCCQHPPRQGVHPAELGAPTVGLVGVGLSRFGGSSAKSQCSCLGVCDSLSYCMLPEPLPRSGVVQKGEFPPGKLLP